MIRTRGRKILRDILSRKGRTVLVAAAILIGVFGVVTLVSVNDLIVSQLHKDIKPQDLPMTRLYVTVPNASVQIDNTAVLATIGRLPGVTHVEGQAVYSVSWKTPGENLYLRAMLLSYSAPFGSGQFEPVRLLKGAFPQPGQHEIAVEKRFADKNGVTVGDSLEFRPLGSGEAPQEWRISGIVFHPYFVLNGNSDVPAEDKIFALYDDAQQIAGFAGYNVLAVRYTDYPTAEAGVDALKETVATETPYIPLWNWTEDPQEYYLFKVVTSVTNVLNMLALIAMIVSGFLVANVINTVVTEQRQQIGILKSIGATRWDIFVIYAGVALVYGIIGLIPGAILGVLAGGVMAEKLSSLALTLIDSFRVSPLGVLLGIALGVLIPVLAALLPVFNATRVSIRSAVTDLGISSTWGRSWFSRVIGSLPLPIHMRQALRNVAQKRTRLALTGLTLMLAAAAFMGVFAMFSSLSSQIRDAYRTIDFQIVANPTAPHPFDELQAAITPVNGVQTVFPSEGFNVDLQGYKSTDPFTTGTSSVPVIGVDTSGNAWNFKYVSGTGWKGDPGREGVVLTTKIAHEIGKQPGDQVTLSANGKQQQYEIIGTIQFPQDLILMRWQTLATLAGFVDQAGNPLTNSVDIRISGPNPTARQVDGIISAITDALAADGVTATYDNQVESLDQATQQLQTFNMVFQITSGVMAAVGAIGLLTALSMAVYERQKEIGIMRSIGAGSSAVVTQFLTEGILVGVIAWVLAIPISYWIAITLGNAFDIRSFTFNYPPFVLALGLIGMVVIATLASLWPSLMASHKTVSDILRYQ
jgi:putative ABC transport system permease protein